MAVNPIANNLKYMMAANDLKQKDLIDLGFSSETIWRLLKADKPYSPYPKTLKRLCDIFNCTISDLTKDAGVNESTPSYKKINRSAEYEFAMRKHLGSLTPELLKQVSDVQHGRQDFVPYGELMTQKCESVPEQTENENPQAQSCEKRHKINETHLASLFADIANSTPLCENIFAEYGSRVLCLVLETLQDGGCGDV